MKHRCLFTYADTNKENLYSAEGLKKLNNRLKNLKVFPYNKEDQIREVLIHSGKISIQGIQPKLSAKLSIQKEIFELVPKDGQYILKPQVYSYPELPENEDLTMHLACLAGLDVPWHGLIKAKDDSLLYITKRFDRLPKNYKLPQEDFAQLLNATRITKYQASMEMVCDTVEKFCSFPTLELEKIFKMTLFSFLIGNEDLHLKNFSVQTTLKGIVKLTPAYDLVNTTIALPLAEEEMALELNGKKHDLTRSDFIDYFAPEYCYVKKERAEKILRDLLAKIPLFEEWIDKSFLGKEMKNKYKTLIHSRQKRLL